MRAIAAILLGALCACGTESAPMAGSTPGLVPAGPGDGVLFVGNSLTYANDLPGLVDGLSSAIGSRLQTASVAYPNYSLGDHLQQGDAVRSIATRGWKLVVLQQGPSSLDASRVLLRRYTATFDQHIRAAGARTALYSVWPDSRSGVSFSDVAESYALAASDVGGIYFPVTDAWVFAFARDASLPLYSSDGFHPSEQGSYLAALVIVSVVTGKSPIGMPARVMRPSGHELSLPESAAGILQEAADAAVTAYGLNH